MFLQLVRVSEVFETLNPYIYRGRAGSVRDCGTGRAATGLLCVAVRFTPSSIGGAIQRADFWGQTQPRRQAWRRGCV